MTRRGPLAVRIGHCPASKDRRFLRPSFVVADGMHVSFVQRLRDWHEQLTAPETDWIQVEVSSYCNAACVYCPRTVYRNTWINRHLSLATFKRLLPAIYNTQLVHLQGWGEPFLNPDFFAMVAMAKATGAQVGTTTNGMLADARLIERILESGLDFIAFSLAGLGETNDRLRVGTRFAAVRDAMRSLDREKQKQKCSTPAIHVSYLLLRSNMDDLAHLPDTLQDLGINQVVVSSLDFVPNGPLERERLPSESGTARGEIHRLVHEVRSAARSKGITIIDNVCGSDTSHRACSENPRHAFCVSSGGMVSPCVFANLPVTHATHRVRGRTKPYAGLVFGDINRDRPAAIWEQKDYVQFRRSFEDGQLHPTCGDCTKRSIYPNDSER